MSTVVSQALQLNASATPAENITLAVPLNPDGSMTVSKGNTQIMKVNTNGLLALDKPLSVGAGAVATTTTIDCSKANRFTYSTTSGSQTFSFTNVPTNVFYDMLLDMSVTAAPVYTKPSIVGTNVDTTVSSSALNITKPAGAQSGDMAVACISISGSATSFTPPSGWTEIVDASDTSGPYVAYKVLDGSEGSTFTFTPQGTTSARGAVTVYRGVAGIRSSARTDTTSSTTLFVAFPNSRIILVGSNGSPTNTPNFASGTTIYAAGSLGVFSYDSQTTIGFTGALTWTGSATNPGALAFALDPVVTSSAPTITWPGSITWKDDIVPPVYETNNLRISLATYNGGTNWYGSYLSLGV